MFRRTRRSVALTAGAVALPAACASANTVTMSDVLVSSVTVGNVAVAAAYVDALAGCRISTIPP